APGCAASRPAESLQPCRSVPPVARPPREAHQSSRPGPYPRAAASWNGGSARRPACLSVGRALTLSPGGSETDICEPRLPGIPVRGLSSDLGKGGLDRLHVPITEQSVGPAVVAEIGPAESIVVSAVTRTRHESPKLGMLPVDSHAVLREA